MATAISIEQEELEELASQIADACMRLGLDVNGSDPVEVGGNALAVWMLPANAVAETLPMESSMPTGRFRFPVYWRGRSEMVLLAERANDGAGHWTVTEFFHSPGARGVDRAISVADAHFEGDEEARLLSIPGYGVEALWIVRPTGYAFVLAAIPRSTETTVGIGDILEESDFVEWLCRLPVIQGLVPEG